MTKTVEAQPSSLPWSNPSGVWHAVCTDPLWEVGRWMWNRFSGLTQLFSHKWSLGPAWQGSGPHQPPSMWALSPLQEQAVGCPMISDNNGAAAPWPWLLILDYDHSGLGSFWSTVSHISSSSQNTPMDPRGRSQQGAWSLLPVLLEWEQLVLDASWLSLFYIVYISFHIHFPFHPLVNPHLLLNGAFLTWHSYYHATSNESR